MQDHTRLRRLHQRAAQTRRHIEHMRYLTAVAEGVIRGLATEHPRVLDDLRVTWGDSRRAPVRLQCVRRRIVLSRPVLLKQHNGIFTFQSEELADWVRHHCAHVLCGVCRGVIHDSWWRACAASIGTVNLGPCNAVDRV